MFRKYRDKIIPMITKYRYKKLMVPMFTKYSYKIILMISNAGTR